MTKMSEIIHLRSAHTIFHSRQERSSQNTKSNKTLGGCSLAPNPTGELTALHSWWGWGSMPPSQYPTPALSSSGFELRPFGPRNWGPVTYCEPGLVRALLRHRLPCIYAESLQPIRTSFGVESHREAFTTTRRVTMEHDNRAGTGRFRLATGLICAAISTNQTIRFAPTVPDLRTHDYAKF